ncbi:MAG: YaaA family protein [Bacteroidales bacterium]|nr:YaaA family protein [Bacteroidales bacterium]
MIFLISSSKRLRKNCLRKGEGTLPFFLEEIKTLHSIIKGFHFMQLKTMLKVNPRMAERIQKIYYAWNPTKLQNGCWALELYHGTTYLAMNTDEWKEEEWNFAQEHVRILSGFYGLLRPKDTVLPYRLEMHAPIPQQKFKTLYEFWGDKLMKRLEEELKSHSEPLILNLASTEFAQAVIPHCPPNVKIITINFLEWRNSKWKIVPVNAKKARGYMVSYLVKNKIDKLEGVKDFKEMNFEYYAAESSDNVMVFRMKQTTTK